MMGYFSRETVVLCRLGGKRGRGASGGGEQTGVERGGRYDKIIWFIKFINFLSLTFRASGLIQSERRRANARNVSLGTLDGGRFTYHLS